MQPETPRPRSSPPEWYEPLSRAAERRMRDLDAEGHDWRDEAADARYAWGDE